MRLCWCNIPQRAVSDGAPLTVVTSTCHSIEPESDVDNTQVNRSSLQSLQAIDFITQVWPLTSEEISVDASVAAVLSELDSISMFNEEHKHSTEGLTWCI